MAGFIETMEQWRRMCEMYSRDDDDRCVGCPMLELKFDEYGCVDEYGCDAIFSDWAKKADWDAVEEAIHVWAERNPEPVYPTWQEWFDTFDEAIDVDESIPADIARKLGIQPEEGTC